MQLRAFIAVNQIVHIVQHINMHKIISFSIALSVVASSATMANDCEYKAGPPDAGKVTAENPIQDKGVTTAWYGDATRIYAHGVLGDSIEAHTLYAKLGNTDDCAISITLDDQSVFEDVTPRIADVTGDGINDVITIESHQNKGASLAVYGVINSQLVKIASAPHIGTPNRWLAPAGIADFNNDGVNDVSYVQTPHIGGILRVWSFKGEGSILLASKRGYSNHRIGENFITGGLRNCGQGPQLVLPDQQWATTQVVSINGKSISNTQYAENTNADTIAKALQCQ